MVPSTSTTSLHGLEIPPPLLERPERWTPPLVYDWETSLTGYLSTEHERFTPFPSYFRVRCNEFRILRQLRRDLFDPARPHASIVEIGCGFGFGSLLMLPYYTEYVGVDIPEPYHAYRTDGAETSVEVARVLVGEALRVGNAGFVTAWPHNLPVESGSASMVYSAYALEHIPNLDDATAEMWRILRPGGWMVHVVPSSLDAILQLVHANLNITAGTLWRLAKGYVGRFLGKTRRIQRIELNGLLVPPCHSEFLDDYSEQIETYSLENYLRPLLDLGLECDAVLKTREHNHVLVMRKP